MQNFYREVVVSEKAITYRTAKAEAVRFYSDEVYRESLPWSERPEALGAQRRGCRAHRLSVCGSPVARAAPRETNPNQRSTL